MADCRFSDCVRAISTMGWCKPHYDAWLRSGDPSSYRGDMKHLSVWERVQEIGWTETAAGCLEYNGYRNELGYGQFRHNGKLHRTHRLAYANLIGELKDDEKVRHKCDNPPCCNPDHLLKGSQADNVRDMVSRGRHAKANLTVCPNGHVYPPDRPTNFNKNRCRVCANDRNRRYEMRREEKRHGMAISGVS